MENKTLGKIIIALVVILIGYWLLNSPGGVALMKGANNTASNLSNTAAVYPAVYPAPATYPPLPQTYYPATYSAYTVRPPVYTYSNVYYQPKPTAYITYPIAKSSGISYYYGPTQYSTASTTTSSYIQPANYPTYPVYSNSQYYDSTSQYYNYNTNTTTHNCYYQQDGNYSCNN